MKPLVFIIIFSFFHVSLALAQKKAKVISPATDVYEQADFDSTVIRQVNPQESFIISNQTFGPFYKVKFKNGVIGFIADTELDIEGQGPFIPKPYVEDVELEKIRKLQDSKLKNKKSDLNHEDSDDDEATSSESISYQGLTVNLINYHEDTLGSKQVADLLALGYRLQPLVGAYDSSLSYEILIAPKAPDYYESKTTGKASGGILWGGVQVANTIGLRRNSTVRYGAGPFFKYSHIEFKTSQKSYLMQDLNLGLDVQAGLMMHYRWFTVDLGLRYFFEKENYGGLSMAILF